MNRKEPKVGLEIVRLNCPNCQRLVAHTIKLAKQGCPWCGFDIKRAFCRYSVTTINLWHGGGKN